MDKKFTKEELKKIQVNVDKIEKLKRMVYPSRFQGGFEDYLTTEQVLDILEESNNTTQET